MQFKAGDRVRFSDQYVEDNKRRYGMARCGDMRGSVVCYDEWGVVIRWVDDNRQSTEDPDGLFKIPLEASMSQAEYIEKRGVICPFCRDDEIETGQVNVDEHETTCEVFCLACGSRWFDTFQLTGFKIE